MTPTNNTYDFYQVLKMQKILFYEPEGTPLPPLNVSANQEDESFDDEQLEDWQLLEDD
jgi:hypothetical protein